MSTSRGLARLGYLLDTHIWLWYAAGSDRLSRGLAAAIEESRDALWLSPISIWELSLLEERGRVELGGGLRSWLAGQQERMPLREAPLTREVALRAHELELPHRDPADRFLAATALTYELTLLTVDQRLTRLRWLPTRSR